MKQIFLCLALQLGYLLLYAQKDKIIFFPDPAEISYQPGKLVMKNSLRIVADQRILSIPAVSIFLQHLRNNAKIPASYTYAPSANTTNLFITDKKIDASENYSLEVNSKGIFIDGQEDGIAYGLETLKQILYNKPASIPFIKIFDHPRFKYRGMHLDVARHFFSVEDVKKYLDFLAMHKFNRFHWHLTDDQGWRIEITQYPELTRTGSCRDQTLAGRFGSDTYDGKKYCGYYTQDQVREIIRYAAQRNITVIPEIDMPGHTLAALASYPFLGCKKGPYEVMQTWGVATDVMCAGNDSTYDFIEDMLTEIVNLFPGKYIHIGGDESPKDRWKSCASCQARIKKEGLKDEHELQGYFTKRVERFLNKKGKIIIGWDEILEGGLAPNATVMSWRGESGGIAAAKLKHEVIMTPETPLYLNHLQSKNEDSITQGGFNSLEMVYKYEPYPASLDEAEHKFILGAQGNMWSEYISNTAKLQYMLFPRMTALSEVLWSPKEKRNWESFQSRIPELFKRYREQKINYSNAYYDLQPAVIQLPGNKIGWKLETRNKEGKINYVRSKTQSSLIPYTGPVEISSSGDYAAAMFGKDHKFLSNWVRQTFYINKASGSAVTLKTMPNRSYAGSGGFSLVDGVHNTVGMTKSAEFLGFLGNDLEAVIDLGKTLQINKIRLRAFEQPASWIYRPASVSFEISDDGVNYRKTGTIDSLNMKRHLQYEMNMNTNTRYIRIIAKNFGIIPSGMPGSGTKAWLFVDEIEVE